MKRLVLVAALLTIAFVAAPAHAMVDCYQYPENAPFDFLGNMNGCYAYANSMCYQCVNVGTGKGCASTRICNPDATGSMQPPKQQADWIPVLRREPVQQPRVAHRKSTLPVPTRVAKLDAGKLF